MNSKENPSGEKLAASRENFFGAIFAGTQPHRELAHGATQGTLWLGAEEREREQTELTLTQAVNARTRFPPENGVPL